MKEAIDGCRFPYPLSPPPRIALGRAKHFPMISATSGLLTRLADAAVAALLLQSPLVVLLGFLQVHLGAHPLDLERCVELRHLAQHRLLRREGRVVGAAVANNQTAEVSLRSGGPSSRCASSSHDMAHPRGGVDEGRTNER
jgi:hypothetical protein